VDAGGGWKLSKHLTLLVSGRYVLKSRYIQMQHVLPGAPVATDILDVGTTYVVAIKGTY
jgi:hypothetical protein